MKGTLIMSQDTNSALIEKLTAYTNELDNLVARMEKNDFPFSDLAFVYTEVSAKIKKILEETTGSAE